MRIIVAFVATGMLLVMACAGPARADAFADLMGAVEAALQAAQAADARQDYATELKLLRPLAEQGNALAQVMLGRMYASGQGVPKDYAEAVRWYRKAAEQGNALAQLMYHFGQGVPKDPAELTLTPQPEAAKDDSMEFVLDRQGGRIFALGPITTDTLEQFDHFVASNSLADAGEHITVVLQSFGGVVDAGLMLGERIRKFKFRTEIGRPRIALGKQLIVEPGDCLSACVYPFLGGVKRSVREQDRIGVHQFFSSSPDSQPSPSVIQIIFGQLVRYVVDMGADARLLVAASEVEGDLHILSMREIREWPISTPSTAAPSPSAQRANLDEALGNLCDELASAPWDPDASGRDKAMDFGKLNASAAIRVCDLATVAFPNERRYWFQLGRAYDKSAQNTKAANIYAKAASMGSGAAMVNLGILFEHGQGVTQDYRSAREWYEKGAKQGNPTGMLCYATTLDNGVGGPVDPVLALKWYESAARNGIADAGKFATQLRELGTTTNNRCN
jgi:TPR repeat protein